MTAAEVVACVERLQRQQFLPMLIHSHACLSDHEAGACLHSSCSEAREAIIKNAVTEVAHEARRLLRWTGEAPEDEAS